MSLENLKQVENSCWLLSLTAVKGIIVFFWSILHLLSLVLFTVSQALFLLVRRGTEDLATWEPAKPRVFGGGIS
jgi:hypothetical protein